jgi:hypothetical protein
MGGRSALTKATNPIHRRARARMFIKRREMMGKKKESRVF